MAWYATTATAAAGVVGSTCVVFTCGLLSSRKNPRIYRFPSLNFMTSSRQKENYLSKTYFHSSFFFYKFDPNICTLFLKFD